MELTLALIAIAVIVSVTTIITRGRSALRPRSPQPADPVPGTAAPVPKTAPARPQEPARDAVSEQLRRLDREAVEALQDRECIYQEKSFVCNVKILRAIASPSGVMLKLEVLPSPGFARQEGTFAATASWEIFSVSKTHVYAAYVGWLVVTEPDLVEEIKAQATKAPEEMPLGVWINRRLFRPKKD